MARCQLLYPGLLGPAGPLEELPRGDWPDKTVLPGLSQLFSHAKAEAVTRQSLEYRILTALGYVISPGAELPIAQLRHSPDTGSDSSMWCLDPVYVQLDREMAYLAASDDLALSETEARQLIDSINQHFADDIRIYYHTPQQWLMHAEWRVSAHTPTESLLQDVGRMSPQGEDAPRWRSRLNEIQMLLHDHPVNVARVEAGKLPVNSVWLWGGGAIDTLNSDLDVVYSDFPLACVAAENNAVSCTALPEQIDATLCEGKNTLFVLTDQILSIQQQDVYAWLAALNAFDRRFLVPILTLLKTGKLSQLQVESDNCRLILNKRDMGKWWRRNKTPAARIMELRKSCGD